MAKRDAVKTADAELKILEEECLKIIKSIHDSLSDTPVEHQPTIRFMGIPILYSAWERFFRMGNAICIRALQNMSVANTGLFSPHVRALLLLRENKYKSFADKIKNGENTHNLLSNTLALLDKWHSAPLNSKVEAYDLVITNSNIDPSVVKINAKALGLDQLKNFKKLNLSRLSDLVGQRNGIGHGNSITPVGEKSFVELSDYTKTLIKYYSKLLTSWLNCLKTGKERKVLKIIM